MKKNKKLKLLESQILFNIYYEKGYNYDQLYCNACTFFFQRKNRIKEWKKKHSVSFLESQKRVIIAFYCVKDEESKEREIFSLY